MDVIVGATCFDSAAEGLRMPQRSAGDRSRIGRRTHEADHGIRIGHVAHFAQTARSQARARLQQEDASPCFPGTAKGFVARRHDAAIEPNLDQIDRKDPSELEQV